MPLYYLGLLPLYLIASFFIGAAYRQDTNSHIAKCALVGSLTALAVFILIGLIVGGCAWFFFGLVKNLPSPY